MSEYAAALTEALVKRLYELEDRGRWPVGVKLMRSECAVIGRELAQRKMLVTPLAPSAGPFQILGLPVVESHEALSIDERFVFESRVQRITASGIEHVSIPGCYVRDSGCVVDLGDTIETSCKCGAYSFLRSAP